MTRGALSLRVAALALLTACAAAPGGAGDGPAPTGSALEDRIVLTAFDVIPAVAASQHMVYIATADGIAALDRDFGRWSAPVALASGFPGGPVTAIAVDPVEEGVWVAIAGAVLYYRPSLGDLSRGSAPGLVDAIIFDQRDPSAGAYLHGTSGWSLASRTGMVVPVDPSRVPPPNARILPSTLAEVYDTYPSLRGAGGLLTQDADLQSWPVIGGSVSPDRSEVWLGTNGGGLFRVDPLFLKGEQLPFGLLQTATGALARDAAGVWMAGLGGGGAERTGLTFTSGDLQQWRWIRSPSVTRAMAGARVFDMSVSGTQMWVGTDRGVVLADAGKADRTLTWSATNGLPDDRVLSVAAAHDGAWVGTARGLAFVASPGSAAAARASNVRVAAGTGVAVRALSLAGDTLWVGSDAGLALLRTSSPDSLPRRVAVDDPRLSRPIRALALSDSLVAVATENDLIVVDQRSVAHVPRFDAVNISVVAPVNAMAMDAGTIWLAGNRGVLSVSRSSGVARLLAAPGVVPAEALDLVLDRAFAWIATPAGVVRLRRSNDGGVR